MKSLIILFVIVTILLCSIKIYIFIDKKRIYKNSDSENTSNNDALKRKEPIKHGMLFNIAKYCFHVYLNWMESIIRLILFLVCYFPSHTIRKLILRYIFEMKIGKNVVIYYGAEIRAPWNISIGDGTIIGDCSKLDGRYGIEIGSNVNFSTGVWIWTAQHDVNAVDFSVHGVCGKVIINNRVWLSCRTVVLPKIEIGEGTVVAAGAVVTKDCDEYSIYGGVPAKKIGSRNCNINYVFDGTHLHFL